MQAQPQISTSFVAKVSCMVTDYSITQPHLAHETENTASGTIFFVSGQSIGLDTHEPVGITNYHCVEDCKRDTCRVFLSNGDYHDCKILYVCPQLDLQL